MRNGLNEDSIRDVDLSPKQSDKSHKSMNRMYAKQYRENMDSGQCEVSEQRAIPERELINESREVEAIPSRDFSSPETSAPKHRIS